MATGIVSDSMADAATGAAAGRNAAENNTLAT
ncbi:VENN motif pre-toxin domain-containing protein [Budvicia aquatica]